jgi:hypothetical protein
MSEVLVQESERQLRDEQRSEYGVVVRAERRPYSNATR